MITRNYRSTAKPGHSAGDLSATDNQIGVEHQTWPTVPFIAALARGTVNEELVLVTGIGYPLSGTTATLLITRAYDGTVAKAHASGTRVEHVTAAIDFSQLKEHVVKNITAANDPAGIDASRLPRSYPSGFSRMFVTNTGGWPAAWGVVETIRSGNDLVQRYTSILDSKFWWRTAAAGADVWLPWQQIGSTAISMMRTV